MSLQSNNDKEHQHPTSLDNIKRIIKNALISTVSYSIFPFYLWIEGYKKSRSYDDIFEKGYKNKEYNPNVAFVIPTKDKGDTIYGVLDSIINQSYRPEKMKIIVTDDHSTDNSLDEILRFYNNYFGEGLNCNRISDNEEICFSKNKEFGGSQIDFTLIKHLNYNEGKQRSINKMISLIDEKEYELTATIDADTKLHQDWLKNSIEYHRDPRVAATFGWVHLWNEKSHGILKKVREFEYNFLLYTRKFFNPDSHWTISGSNVLYKTDILKKYPIPEHMKENAAEDLLHTIELQSKGYRIIFVPDAIAYSKEDLDWKSFVKQSTRWTKGSWYVLLEYALPNEEVWNNLSRRNKLLIGSFFALPFYHISIAYALITGTLTHNPYALFWVTLDYSSFLGMALYGYKEYKNYIGETKIRNIIRDYTAYYFGRNLLLIPYFKGFIEYLKTKRLLEKSGK